MSAAALSRPRVLGARRAETRPTTLVRRPLSPHSFRASPAAAATSPSPPAAPLRYRSSSSSPPRRRSVSAGAAAAAAAASASSDEGGDAPATPPPLADAAASSPAPAAPPPARATASDDPSAADPPLWPRVAALLPRWLGEASPLRLLDPPLAGFLAGGALLSAAFLNWVGAVSPLRRVAPYQFTIVFSEAHKVGEGTPVRMKGVEVGIVKTVRARPDAVAVGVEVFSGRQVVPLASRIDVNALGLMADAVIDITPPEGGGVGAGAAGGASGAAAAALAGPRDPRCAAEGRVVCDGARVAGHQGANMNFMMRMWLEHNDRARTKVEW